MKMSEVSDSEGHSVLVSIDNHDDVASHLGPETVQIINLQPDSSPTVMEPPLKRIRNEDLETTPTPAPGVEGQTIKQILFNINKAICLRLDAIENKLETVSVRTKYLESRMEQISQQIKETPSNNVIVQQNRLGVASRRSGAVIVGLPQEKEEVSGDSMNSSLAGSEGNSADGVQNLGPNVTLITLNSEEDFPHGCWLGDENNPEMRVRAPIMPSDLLHIHSNCRTPEKMALTLLDYLFDRETQALSNLSGMGKHGKRQLDPLMIYGIRCHLIHKFGITEQDWHRIKQNIDSKCRTAFRRRLKGMPLQVKAFRGKAPPTYAYVAQGNDNESIMHEISAEELQQVEDGQLHISEGEVDMTHPVLTASTATEIIQNSGTEIQVLHATPEQVAQLQQTHQIQILQGDQVLQEMQSGDAHPTSLPSGIRVVSTSGGLSHGPFRVVTSPGSLSEGIRVVNASTGQLVATGPSGDTINIQPQVEADDEEEEPIVNETDVVQDSDQ